MERRACTEKKNSYKKWSCKEVDAEKKVKILVGGKILKGREDPGNQGVKNQGIRGDIGWQHPRWVMMSRGTAGTNLIFWRPSWVSSNFSVLKGWRGLGNTVLHGSE